MMKKNKGAFTFELIITFPIFLLLFFVVFNEIFKFNSQNVMDDYLNNNIRNIAISEEGTNKEKTGGVDIWYQKFIKNGMFQYSEIKILNMNKEVLFSCSSNDVKEKWLDETQMEEVNDLWINTNVVCVYVRDSIYDSSNFMYDLFLVKINGKTYNVLNTNITSEIAINIENVSKG